MYDGQLPEVVKRSYRLSQERCAVQAYPEIADSHSLGPTQNNKAGEPGSLFDPDRHYRSR